MINKVSIIVIVLLFNFFVVEGQLNKKELNEIEKNLNFQGNKFTKREKELFSKDLDTVHFMNYLNFLDKEIDVKLKRIKKIKKASDSLKLKSIEFLEELKYFNKNSLFKLYKDLIYFKELLFKYKEIASERPKLRIYSEFIEKKRAFNILINNVNNMNMKSLDLLKEINKSRKRLKQPALSKESNPYDVFSKYCLKDFVEMGTSGVDEIYENKKEILRKKHESSFNKQIHRFKFVKGLLYYNDFLLVVGTTLKSIENKIGTDYVKLKEDSNLRRLRYRNIPLAILVSKENKIIAFRVFTQKEKENEEVEKEDYSYVKGSYIKIENYFINKDSNGLSQLENGSLCEKITKDLKREVTFTSVSKRGYLLKYGKSKEGFEKKTSSFTFEKSKLGKGIRDFFFFINNDSYFKL